MVTQLPDLKQLVVEDFFQEDDDAALRQQVVWMEAKFGLDSRFFSKLLRIPQPMFLNWKGEVGALPLHEQEKLKVFWGLVLHLLSHLDFDSAKVNRMLHPAGGEGPTEHEESATPPRVAFDPPWANSSLKSYLEREGEVGVREAARWVAAMRFGDSF